MSNSFMTSVRAALNNVFATTERVSRIISLTLRICAPQAFRLHWSTAGNAAWRDEDSRSPGLDAHFLDIPAGDFDPYIEFTFFWKDKGAWEGRNYRVTAY
jgi:hypothetical protein